MIPNHQSFIDAIHAKKKVCVRFYSKADSGVLDRVCAPIDYGPGKDNQDGLNRYWLWDYAGNPGSKLLSLGAQEIVDVQILGDVFDPTQVEPSSGPWSIPRDWAAPSSSANIARETSRPIGAKPMAPSRKD